MERVLNQECYEDRYHSSRLHESCCYPHDEWTALLAGSVQSHGHGLLLRSEYGSCQNYAEYRLALAATHRFDGSLLHVDV